MTTSIPSMPVDAERIFRREIMTWYSRGWGVASTEHNVQSNQRMAVLSSRAGECNHVVHAIMTLFTLGLWLPIWFLVAITTPGPQMRQLIVDNTTGQVTLTKPVAAHKFRWS